MRSPTIIVVIALALPAHAHHVTSDLGSTAKNQTLVDAGVEVGRFDFDDAHGNSMALVIGGEFAPLDWLSVSARVPLALALFDDHSTVVGIGDVDAAARVQFFADEDDRLIVSGGAGVEMPTGDAARHLGGGHFELAPFALVFTKPLPQLALLALAADHLSLEGLTGAEGDGAEGAHGSVLAPHTDHEAAVRLLASTTMETVTLTCGAEATLVVDGAVGPFTLVAQIAGMPWHDLRLAAGLDVPIGGDIRLPWVGRAGVTVLFH